MVKISIINKSIIVSNFSKEFAPDIISMLVDQWNFVEQGGKLKYGKEFDSLFVYEIYKYISDLGEKISLDSTSEEYVQIHKTQLENLKNAIESGQKIRKGKSLLEAKYTKLANGAKLKPYQIPSVSHSTELDYSANFSVPGSGKTWMAYFAYEEMKRRKEVQKMLVVAPLSAFRPWEFEYEQIYGIKPTSYRIKSRSMSSILNHLNNEIFLVSYTAAANKPHFLIDLLENSDFLLVCDESHAIKNPYSQRAQGLLKIGKYAKKKMILTGTPMPQGPNDLWSQFTFLLPEGNDILGNFDYYRYRIKNQQFPEIKKTLEPLYTRVRLEDLKLPKPILQKRHIEMSPYQEQIYNAITGTLLAGQKLHWKDDFELEKWRTNIVIYLLAAALDPTLLQKKKKNTVAILDYKNKPFTEMIDNYAALKEIPNKITKAIETAIKIVEKKEKVVVWCTRVKTIERMKMELKKRGYDSITVTGKIPQDEEADPNDNREKRIEEFKTTDTNVLIANPASCAESISLHKHCQKAIYLDRNFNGAHYMQSLSRIHRVNMPKKTNPKYLMLLSEDSIDDDVDSRLTFKHKTMLNFLNDDFKTFHMDMEEDNLTDTVFGTGDYFENKADFEQVLKHHKKRKK
jgi:SNF2 family DNA or RNA helicase